jgi:hypothetical protein
MADKKISQLTAATTPLAGTEVLPIVQSGSTVKVSVDNLTAGKSVSASSFTATGNSSAAKFVPTGGTAAGNGMYLPGTNTLGWSLNGVKRAELGPDGNSLYYNFSGSTLDAAVQLYIEESGTSSNFYVGTKNSGTLASKLKVAAAGDVTVQTGNLVVGTAAKGIQDGSNVDRISIASASTVVNESGADLDFRVEGDTNANLLFVDAGNDRVGIRTSTPNTPLEVVGGGGIRVDEDGTSTNVIVVRSDFAGVGPAINVVSNSPLLFQTNNTERARITATGNIVAGASVALATNASDGFLYVPTCAGTPTGTPTTITGMAPIVVDTTNNKLYFYSGGQWRDAGP